MNDNLPFKHFFYLSFESDIKFKTDGIKLNFNGLPSFLTFIIPLIYIMAVDCIYAYQFIKFLFIIIINFIFETTIDVFLSLK